MKVSEEVFACHSKACAPPPVGTGGSGGGKGGGGSSAKAMTAKYGSRQSGGGGRRRQGIPSIGETQSAKKAKGTAGQKAAERWARGKGKGQADSANPRTPSTVLDMTKRFGGRTRGKGAPASTPKPKESSDAQRALELTKKYGSRRRSA